jgi:hypothetical protein
VHINYHVTVVVRSKSHVTVVVRSKCTVMHAFDGLLPPDVWTLVKPSKYLDGL